MIPNNNLSVLPFYKKLEDQNAKKWWIYGHVYPLYTPAGYFPPFQILQRRSRTTPDVIGDIEGYPDRLTIFRQLSGNPYTVVYDVSGATTLYFDDAPSCYGLTTGNPVMCVAVDSNDTIKGYFNPVTTGRYSGQWTLPSGTEEVYVLMYNKNVGEESGRFWTNLSSVDNVTQMRLYKENGQLVKQFSTAEINNSGITIKTFPNYDVVVFPSNVKMLNTMENGRYYLWLVRDGSWYSDVFTVVNDIEPYLKITWWDSVDFSMDAGTIVYANPSFKNVLYLPSDLAKPEYPFEEEGEMRDGYFFPIKQISEKRYRFNFMAPEYLLDVMRFIRMSDFIEIDYHGQNYKVDTFLISPEWENNGDLAVVEATFDTATVAKKIGRGYVIQNNS